MKYEVQRPVRFSKKMAKQLERRARKSFDGSFSAAVREACAAWLEIEQRRDLLKSDRGDQK